MEQNQPQTDDQTQPPTQTQDRPQPLKVIQTKVSPFQRVGIFLAPVGNFFTRVGLATDRVVDAVQRLSFGRLDACPTFSVIPTESDNSIKDAAWPPERHPVKALPVQKLFAANARLIRNLCYASELSEKEYEAYLLPTIANLAHFVHLLPASQNNHHTGYGGLFTHSLDVAYYAASRASMRVFDISATPEQTYFNAKRWTLVCILAGLLHDVGKPYTDMNVTLVENGKSWDKSMPLLDWLRKNKAKEYYVTFLDTENDTHKHNYHVQASLTHWRSVVPQKTLEFLSGTGIGNRLEHALTQAILYGANEGGGEVGKILHMSDAASCEADILQQAKIHPGYQNIDHPQASPILRALKLLIAQDDWIVNKGVESRVFNTKQGCFVVWNKEIALAVFNKCASMNAKGIPSDPEVMADILVSAKAAVPNVKDGHVFSNLWNVTPITTKDKALPCLKITYDGFIFDGVPPPKIDSVADGYPIDEATKKAWVAQWKCLPATKFTPEDLEAGFGGRNLDADTAPTFDPSEQNVSPEEENRYLEQADLEDTGLYEGYAEQEFYSSGRDEGNQTSTQPAAASRTAERSAQKAKHQKITGTDVAIPPEQRTGVAKPEKPAAQPRQKVDVSDPNFVDNLPVAAEKRAFKPNPMREKSKDAVQAMLADLTAKAESEKQQLTKAKAAAGEGKKVAGTVSTRPAPTSTNAQDAAAALFSSFAPEEIQSAGVQVPVATGGRTDGQAEQNSADSTPDRAEDEEPSNASEDDEITEEMPLDYGQEESSAPEDGDSQSSAQSDASEQDEQKQLQDELRELNERGLSDDEDIPMSHEDAVIASSSMDELGSLDESASLPVAVSQTVEWSSDGSANNSQADNGVAQGEEHGEASAPVSDEARAGNSGIPMDLDELAEEILRQMKQGSGDLIPAGLRRDTETGDMWSPLDTVRNRMTEMGRDISALFLAAKRMDGRERIEIDISHNKVWLQRERL